MRGAGNSRAAGELATRIWRQEIRSITQRRACATRSLTVTVTDSDRDRLAEQPEQPLAPHWLAGQLERRDHVREASLNNPADAGRHRAQRHHWAKPGVSPPSESESATQANGPGLLVVFKFRVTDKLLRTHWPGTSALPGPAGRAGERRRG
jgi:hypothetical protein